MSQGSREQIGLFGGTFDPPHLGHLILASEAFFQLELDRLLWILTPQPPHKQDQAITPVEHRLAMVNLAIEDNPSFELSRVELDRPGPHYTLDTVEIIANQYPEADITPIIGGELIARTAHLASTASIIVRLSLGRRDAPSRRSSQSGYAGKQIARESVPRSITWTRRCSRSPRARSGSVLPRESLSAII